MRKLIVSKGIIIDSNITANQIQSFAKGNEKFIQVVNMIIKDEIGIVVYLNDDNPTINQLNNLYDAMLEIGGFEIEVFLFSEFSKTILQ